MGKKHSKAKKHEGNEEKAKKAKGAKAKKAKKEKDAKAKKPKKARALEEAIELKVCPCCSKHCPLTKPKCSKGRKLAAKLGIS